MQNGAAMRQHDPQDATRSGVPFGGGPLARAKQKPSAAAGSRISGCRCASATPATARTVAMALPWVGGRGASGWAIARKHHWPAGAPFPPIYRGAGQSCESSSHGFGRRVFQRFSEYARRRLWLWAWLALGEVSVSCGWGLYPLDAARITPSGTLVEVPLRGGATCHTAPTKSAGQLRQ